MSTDSIRYDVDWLAHFLFGREAGPDADLWTPEWEWRCEPISAIALVTQLMAHSDALVRPHKPDEIENGFWFLMGPRFNLAASLWDETLPYEPRRQWIESMVTLFQDVFAVVPTPTICHMWWDLVVTSSNARSAAITAVVVAALADVLKLDDLECRRSALHGLGHVNNTGSRLVIDEWLRTNPPLDPELSDYALRAREGRVQ